MNVSLFSTFTSIAPGGIRGPDSSADAFLNLFGKPVWIQDLVFDWDWTIPSRGAAQTFGAPLGDAIRAQIKYANHPLTSGFVPVCLLGQVTNPRASTPALRSAAQVVHSTFTWHLPEPLWLPPNMPLTVMMQHQNDFAVDTAAASQTIDVTARGVLDEQNSIPDTIDIPYAASYLTPVQSTVSGGQTGVSPAVISQSGQTDLFNPFQVPLNVERMTFGISVSSTGLDGAQRANFAPTDAISAQDQTGSLVIGQNYGLDRRYVTLKMISGKGRAIVNNYTPIGAVMPSTSRSWDMRTILDPADYVTAFISQQMPLFTDGATLPFQMRTGLALIASRRLSLAESIATY